MQTQILLKKQIEKPETESSSIFAETCRILYSAKLCTGFCTACKIAHGIDQFNHTK